MSPLDTILDTICTVIGGISLPYFARVIVDGLVSLTTAIDAIIEAIIEATIKPAFEAIINLAFEAEITKDKWVSKCMDKFSSSCYQLYEVTINKLQYPYKGACLVV